MELKIVREGEWTPMALGGSAGVSGDILTGRDTEVTWEDVFKGMVQSFSAMACGVLGRLTAGQVMIPGRVLISMRRWRGS